MSYNVLQSKSLPSGRLFLMPEFVKTALACYLTKNFLASTIELRIGEHKNCRICVRLHHKFSLSPKNGRIKRLEEIEKDKTEL